MEGSTMTENVDGNSEDSEGAWTYVKSRKKKRNAKADHHHNHNHSSKKENNVQFNRPQQFKQPILQQQQQQCVPREEEAPISWACISSLPVPLDDLEAVITKVENAVTAMKANEFLRAVKFSIQDCFVKLKFSGDFSMNFKCIVCYGLGNFSSSVIALNQLALLICIYEKYGMATGLVELYDPVFTSIEKAVLQDKYGFRVLGVNEDARRLAKYPTFFFMPHCEHTLLNNLFSVNMNSKYSKNCIVYGNRFSSLPVKDLIKLEYLYRATNKITEFGPYAIYKNNTHVFNDMSIFGFVP